MKKKMVNSGLEIFSYKTPSLLKSFLSKLLASSFGEFKWKKKLKMRNLHFSVKPYISSNDWLYLKKFLFFAI